MPGVPPAVAGGRSGSTQYQSRSSPGRGQSSLRDDPDAARMLLCPRPGDERLWYWVDPERPPATAAGTPGIPPRTLARLIERLERLGD